MNLEPWAGLVLSMVTMVATAGAVYGAIKADLKAMHQRIDRLQAEVDYNRSRIDGAPRGVRA